MKIIDFSDIFEYAERIFGVNWNPANDMFFGNALRYGNVTDVYAGEGIMYTALHEDERVVLDIPIEEIKVLSIADQSYLIMDHYFAANGIKGDVMVDAR